MQFPYPKSFPNSKEEQFLKLVLSDDAVFESQLHHWEKDLVFDNIDGATLKLVPLLYLRLQKNNVQTPLLGRIKGVYKMAWFENQLLLDALKKMITTFDQAHIPVLVLKGVSLLIDIYQDPGARVLGDGDILMNPKDVLPAFKLLQDNGWKDQSPEARKNTSIREAHFANHHDIEVDIHWALFKFNLATNTEHPMTFDRVEHDAVPLIIQNVRTKTLCPEDMLIHLIAHGADANIHRPLRWVVDTVSLIRKKNINWTKVLEKTHTYNLVIEMRIACRYLAENYSVDIPKSFLDDLTKIEIPPTMTASYYHRANNTPHNLLFGTVPQLWTYYWQYKAKGNSVQKAFGFSTFLTQYWGLKNTRELIKFVGKKYWGRVIKK